MKERLQKLGLMILEKSYKEGTFTLVSGKTSDFFIDAKQTFLEAQGSVWLGECFWEMIKRYCPQATVVAGVPVGATPLVTAISMMSLLDQSSKSLPLAQGIVRKEPKDHGSGKQIEMPQSVLMGSSVVLIDDVLTTGGTNFVAWKALTEAGYQVDMIAVVVDREEGGRDYLIRKTGCENIHAIFSRSELLAMKPKKRGCDE